MKKITCTALTLLSLSANVMGATVTANATTDANKSSSTSIKDYYKQLKDSPFGLLVLNETVIDRKMDGFQSETLFYADYKFGKNKVSIIPSFTINNQQAVKDAHLEYGYTQFRYTRYDLLTEEENGVKLDAQVRGYVNNDNARLGGTDTVVRPKIEMKKNWGKFSLFNDTSLYLYQNNENFNDESKTSRLLIQVTPAYQVSDKLALSVDFINYNETYETTDEGKTTEDMQKLRVISNVSYDFDSGISLTGYVDVTPQSSVDETAEDWASKAAFGTALTYKLF